MIDEQVSAFCYEVPYVSCDGNDRRYDRCYEVPNWMIGAGIETFCDLLLCAYDWDDMASWLGRLNNFDTVFVSMICYQVDRFCSSPLSFNSHSHLRYQPSERTCRAFLSSWSNPTGKTLTFLHANVPETKVWRWLLYNNHRSDNCNQQKLVFRYTRSVDVKKHCNSLLCS